MLINSLLEVIDLVVCPTGDENLIKGALRFNYQQPINQSPLIKIQ